jgi:hypothetical protein
MNYSAFYQDRLDTLRNTIITAINTVLLNKHGNSLDIAKSPFKKLMLNNNDDVLVINKGRYECDGYYELFHNCHTDDLMHLLKAVEYEEPILESIPEDYYIK